MDNHKTFARAYGAQPASLREPWLWNALLYISIYGVNSHSKEKPFVTCLRVKRNAQVLQLSADDMPFVFTPGHIRLKEECRF